MAQATKETKSKTNSKTKSAPKTYVYQKLQITCVCGGVFDSGSTLDKIRVDICSKCHPFFTGESRLLDAEGRVEKFKKKYNLK
jgi:large subunit ribosomal protein L31